MTKKFKNLKPLPQELLLPNEQFILITDKIVPFIFDYYCISNYGRVWHRYLGKFMSPGVSGSGYLFFMASTEYGPKPIQIHRAVMMAFNPVENMNLLEVNHEDGNKLNPVLSNLSWSTHKENVDHAYRTGLHQIGESNVHSKITSEQAEEICKLLQRNYTSKEIVSIIGDNCTTSIVDSIRKGESWVNISNKYPKFHQRICRLFSVEQIRNLCQYFQNNPIYNLTVNDHCRNALRFYGYDDCDRCVDTVRKLYNRKYYTNISCEYKF